MEYQIQIKYAEVLQENPLAIIKSTEVINPTPSQVEMIGKRTHLEAMEIEEEENSESSKSKNTKSEGESVEVSEDENNKGKMKVKGPSFELQEYEFLKVLETFSDKFRSKTDLYDKYKKDKDIFQKNP